MNEEDPDSRQPDPPAPPTPRSASRPPVPPPAGLLRREETPLMEYMRHRMEIMERELIKERERASSSENLIKQQEALRGEVESQLKNLSNQLRQEKTVAELQSDKSASRGRVDALEKRLDEMHQSWIGLLKEAVSRKETEVAFAGPEAQAMTDGLSAVRQEVLRLKEQLSGLPGLVPEVQHLRAILPDASQRRVEEEKALREQLRAMIDRMSETLLERMTGLDRRLGQEVAQQQERLSAIAREREALRETLDEQRHEIRQEYLKERNALEAQFNSRVVELKDSLTALSDRHGEARDSLAAIEKLSKDLHLILSRPAKAKDQMVSELEAEKRDLMKALKDRSEQMRENLLERREVEHSLGESLMELHRQLEIERSKDRQRAEHIAALQSAGESLKAEAALLSKQGEQKDERFHALAAERDKLVAALTEEAGKVSRQIEERMLSDKRWEGKILDLQKAMDDERQARIHAEHTTSDLRAQTQSLTDHIARMARDKELAENDFIEFKNKREALMETLRKKDEMIAMLSSTFQNLLKRPAAPGEKS